MRSVKFLIAAGAASLLSQAALAADMAIAPPPQYYAPPPAQDFGGWYLRGDIGMTNQSVGSLGLTSAPNPAGFQPTGMGFDSSTSFDVGVGYRFNSWFRADVTGEYRGAANFNGSQFLVAGAGAPFTSGVDNYTASKSEWVGMVNGYVDLGTWWCMTPFVGAGVGASRNTISGFRDDGIFNDIALTTPQAVSSTFGATASKWNLAWALYAGVAYNITQNVAIELAYRYMNLGDGVTGPTNSFDGVTVVNGSGFTFKNITSNDVKLGVRWQFDNPQPVYQPPLVTKG
jgi:opacity protein-like surface antigen